MNDRDVVLAVDAMGGDHAPEAIAAGACRTARMLGCQVVLVGDRSRLTPLLRRDGTPASVSIRHAPEAVAMDEVPSGAVRRGAATSMGACIELVRDGSAHAAFSAGNSGAFLAYATVRLRTLPGVARPAIATVWPVWNGPMLLLDAGANVDCRPEWIAQFAVMGSAYARAVLGIESPRVGLLSIGEEERKGNALTEEAYPLLKGAPINFIGNVEGRDLLVGDVDVAVCDGFVGNVALKLAEGAGEYFARLLRRAVRSSARARLGALLMRPQLKDVAGRLDQREHGGAPLLGVRGYCFIGHGRADARAVDNACRAAVRAVREDVLGAIGSLLTGSTGAIGAAP